MYVPTCSESLKNQSRGLKHVAASVLCGLRCLLQNVTPPLQLKHGFNQLKDLQQARLPWIHRTFSKVQGCSGAGMCGNGIPTPFSHFVLKWL